MKEKASGIDVLLEFHKTNYIVAQITKQAYDSGGLQISDDQFVISYMLYVPILWKIISLIKTRHVQ